MNRIILLLFVTTLLKAQSTYHKSLADSALTLTKDEVVYDPSYYSIPYPNGDVPQGIGVCTDVVIRTYRKKGFDLQKAVHEDMKHHFHLYPKKWGLSRTDRNIDHRRVPNLMTYFKRKGAEIPITSRAQDYLPGDIVCWDLGDGITHIGIVSRVKNNSSTRWKIVHNIGRGQELEDMLFDFTIIGHYRFKP